MVLNVLCFVRRGDIELLCTYSSGGKDVVGSTLNAHIPTVGVNGQNVGVVSRV